MQAHNAYADTSAATAITTNSEVVALTLTAGVTVPANTQVILEAAATLTTGTSTTAVVLRIRRGTTTGGTLVGKAFTIQSAAAVLTTISGQAADTPGEVAGQSYVVTLQQTAGAADGTLVFASLQASWIS